MSRAASTLGSVFIDADLDNGTIELAFTAIDDWTNPVGNVLGAFVRFDQDESSGGDE